jgi:hypothetical protein
MVAGFLYLPVPVAPALVVLQPLAEAMVLRLLLAAICFCLVVKLQPAMVDLHLFTVAVELLSLAMSLLRLLTAARLVRAARCR